MRKIAMLAMLALVIGFVPMTSASSQVEALANGDVHFVQGVPGVTIDICEGTDTLADGLGNGEFADVSLAGGNHAISIAINPGDCSGATVPITTINVAGGQQQTMIIGPAPPAFVYGVNDTSTTPADTTRLTLRNSVTTGPIGICVGGEVVADTVIPVTGVGQAQAEVPAGPTDDLSLFVGGTCQPGQPATLAACTNLVLNVYATGGDPPFAVDNQFFIVGCELPESANDTTAFCSTLLGLQGVQATLEETFGSVVPGDESTYPSADAVEALVNDINALLATGDESVPPTVEPQWQIVTSGLRELVAGLTAASFDLSNLTEDQVAEIVDGITNPPPNPEVDAATEVLTQFFIGSCGAAPVELTPTFTG